MRKFFAIFTNEPKFSTYKKKTHTKKCTNILAFLNHQIKFHENFSLSALIGFSEILVVRNLYVYGYTVAMSHRYAYPCTLAYHWIQHQVNNLPTWKLTINSYLPLIVDGVIKITEELADTIIIALTLRKATRDPYDLWHLCIIATMRRLLSYTFEISVLC